MAMPTIKPAELVPSAFQAINLPIRDTVPSRVAAVSEKVDEGIGDAGNREDAGDHAGLRSPGQHVQQEDVIIERLNVPERDWNIVKIIDKRRDSAGLVEYLVEWADSEHPSSVLQPSGENQWMIMVDGIEWEVSERSRVRTGIPGGVGQELVRWKRTWLPAWELPKESVKDFEAELKETRTEKMDNDEPAWWKWTEHGHVHLSPEGEPRPGTRRVMNLEIPFHPEIDADYTIGFLEAMRRQLSVQVGPKLPKATLIRFLNLCIRQRLRFPAAGQSHSLERPERIRALLVYIFGKAMVVPCRCCASHKGPFPKCVTWLTEFKGACANCAFNKHNPRCEYHANNAHDELPKLSNHSISEGLSEESSSPISSQGLSGVAARSSVDVGEDVRQLTPASSQDQDDLEVLQSLLDNQPDGVHESRILDPIQSAAPPFPIVVEGPDAATESRDDRGVKRRIERMDMAPSGPSQGNEEPRNESSSLKRQRTDSPDMPRAQVVHLYCSASPHHPCTDPDAGIHMAYPSPLVFSNQTFAAHEATDDEVRYIISRCDCYHAEYFHDVWRNLQRKKEERRDGERWPSKERYISARRWEKLNECVVMFCPWPFGKDEVVDLTGGD